jgi:hypothetical protein
MVIGSPVAGLRPCRSGRSVTLKRPKPASAISSPEAAVVVITVDVLSITFFTCSQGHVQ